MKDNEFDVRQVQNNVVRSKDFLQKCGCHTLLQKVRRQMTSTQLANILMRTGAGRSRKGVDSFGRSRNATDRQASREKSI